MFLFLTVVQAIVAAALVGVILMQKSEGGGLGIGGSPTGMLSARGAADFLSRTTKWLAVAFVTLSIILAAVAVENTTGSDIESTLDRNVTTETPSDPLGGTGSSVLGGTTESAPAEDTAPSESDDPLAN
ncbi:preprotein translocase subunit SecG [Erythrobacter sp. W53]|uniref:preprotein translocase subunit SecG n=1 Tax=Erythrobacter sp. W53 TaxID=3425947 RepID=UPI003D769C8A